MEIIKTLHRHDSILNELTSLDNNGKNNSSKHNVDPRFKFKSKYVLPKIEHKFNHVLYDRNISSRGNVAKLVDYLNGMDAGDSDDCFDDDDTAYTLCDH